MAKQNISFQKVATVPATGLTVGRIYFETSSGTIKVATTATTAESYGGVLDAILVNNILTLKRSVGADVVLDLSDVASATSVSAELATKATITALNAVKSTADAAAPQATTYTKTEVDNKVATAVGSVYKMKGSIANVAALTALTNVSIGDTYNVIAAGTINGEAFEAGSNFVATKAGAGSQTAMWDKLGGTIDLSAYAKTTDVASTYATKAAVTTEIGAKITTLDKADAPVAGQVVSSVSEANGIITVTRRALIASDIPAIPTSRVTGLDTALASKVQSFGGKTGSITLAANVSTNGAINLTMDNNELQASVIGLGSAAYTAATAYATTAQGALAASALQSANIASGATNGTIAVKGVDVAIKGLGTAAYTASSAYDSAGSSTTALANAKSYADGLMMWADFA